MKLYSGAESGNSWKVRILLEQLRVPYEKVMVDLLTWEHKTKEFIANVNPRGQVPVLELDDGTCISESLAICRYLEELYPTPPLFGRDPVERAQTEMWLRRSEFRLWNPMGQVWINADPRTAAVNPNQFHDFGEHSKKIVASAMRWIDRDLSDGREFLAGPNYSMADIVLLCGIDFSKFINMDMPQDAMHLRAWHARVSARPSASA